jgi:hypothetical protein
MNKIEKAIYDTKLRLKEKERQLLICKAELTTLEKQLEALICINQDDSIPHEDEVKHQ